MADLEKYFEIRREGLYFVPGNFYIDPMRPVDNAFVTHGHADHARAGHQNLFATRATIDIMKVRYGENSAEKFTPLEYGEVIQFNNCDIYLVSAGHILGSAQIVINYNGHIIVASGDYKRRLDPTAEPFKLVKNPDIFITEATFAIPVFRNHPPIEKEVDKLFASIQSFPEKNHLVGVYALGKCQRLILALREKGYNNPLYMHGALFKLCDLYKQYGFDFGELIQVNKDNKKSLKGEIILCPPSALADKWSRGFGETIRAMASGWMQIRARAKQRRVELPLIISDHADWNELTDTILEMKPKNVWVTHGQEDALVHWCDTQGIKAKALRLIKN